MRAFRYLSAVLLLPNAATADPRLPIVIDAEERAVGTYLQSLPHTDGHSMLGVLSPRGYTFAVGATSGQVSRKMFAFAGVSDTILTTGLRFTEPDCAGIAYLFIQSSPVVAGGFLVSFDWYGEGGGIYYAPRGELPELRQVISQRAHPDAPCTGDTGERLLYRALPNDPAETGVPDEDFIPPLSLGSLGAWRDLFKDGFEAIDSA